MIMITYLDMLIEGYCLRIKKFSLYLYHKKIIGSSIFAPYAILMKNYTSLTHVIYTIWTVRAIPLT